MDAREWIRDAVGAPAPDDDTDETAPYLVRNAESGIVVREAVSEDAPAISAVGSRSFHHAHAAVLHPVDLAGVATRFDEAAIRKDLADPDSRWLIALWTGETVGFAHIRTATIPTDRLGRFPIELHGIYVAPDWSGNGVGKTLVDASSKLALSLGYDSLWVRVFAANRAARAFLRALSFDNVHRDLLIGRKSSAPVLTFSRSLTTRV